MSAGRSACASGTATTHLVADDGEELAILEVCLRGHLGESRTGLGAASGWVEIPWCKRKTEDGESPEVWRWKSKL